MGDNMHIGEKEKDEDTGDIEGLESGRKTSLEQALKPAVYGASCSWKKTMSRAFYLDMKWFSRQNC